MIHVATTEDVQKVVDERIERLEKRLPEVIAEALRPEWIGLEEVSEALGYSRKASSSEWLKRHPDITVVWDHRPIRVHRKEFNDKLYELGQ